MNQEKTKHNPIPLQTLSPSLFASSPDTLSLRQEMAKLRRSLDGAPMQSTQCCYANGRENSERQIQPLINQADRLTGLGETKGGGGGGVQKNCKSARTRRSLKQNAIQDVPITHRSTPHPAKGVHLMKPVQGHFVGTKLDYIEPKQHKEGYHHQPQKCRVQEKKS